MICSIIYPPDKDIHVFKTKVNQKDFGVSGNEGRCLAISGLWCKLIVETGAYTSKTDRFLQWFDKKEVKKRQRLLTLRKLAQEIKDRQDSYSAYNTNTTGNYFKKWDVRTAYLTTTIRNNKVAELNEKFPTLPPVAENVLSIEAAAQGLNWENSRASKNKPPAATFTVAESQQLVKKRASKVENLVDEAIQFGISNCGLKVTHGTRTNWVSALSYIEREHGCYTLSLSDAKTSKHTMAVCFLAIKDDEENEFVLFDPNQYEIYCTKAELATLLAELKNKYSAELVFIYRVMNKAG